MKQRLLFLYFRARNFVTGQQAASGFAEEAVKIFVVAAIVGVMIWIGTVIEGMLRNAGGML
mgnify:CR=1 FL=1